MTDKELRDAAVVELKKTTQGYLKSNGQPRALIGAQWKKGLDLLAQIGQANPVPPPPTGTALHTREHFLAQGAVGANTVYDSPGTEVFPLGSTNGDKHGTINWRSGAKYEGRKTYALFGMRLVQGSPGRVWNFHTQPAGTGSWGVGGSGGVSPLAVDYYGGGGLEVTVEPENQGTRESYHFQIMSAAEIDSKLGQMFYVWGEIVWGRRDGTTPMQGSLKWWVAGEDVPRVNRQGINTHWATQDMVTFWQMIYWNTGTPTPVTIEHPAPRFGRTPRECFEDKPVFYSHWGNKTMTQASPAGDGWNTKETASRLSNEPAIPASLRW